MSDQAQDQSKNSLYMRQLGNYLTKKAELRIFLTTGVGLVGILLDYDEDCILISSSGSEVPSLIMRENVLSLSDSSLSQDASRARRDNTRRDNTRRDNNHRDYDRTQPTRNY
jgi:sRNA-binding regulator protein Hfq